MSEILAFGTETQQARRYIRLELGRRQPQDVPFGDLLSYGANGSPTITITKTLFSAAQVTSTKATVLSTGPLIDLDGSFTTNAALAATAASTSKTTPSTLSATSNASKQIEAGAPAGKVAGATFGSMAAVGFVGFFIWLLYLRNGKEKKSLKATFSFKRRKSSSSSPKTSQLGNQSMEQTRSKMLQKSLQEKNRSNPTLSATPTIPSIPLERMKSTTESARSRPSWIGLAVSSTTPPHTPPLPRSHSQKSTNTAHSVGVRDPSTAHPSSLTPGFGSIQQPQYRPQQPPSSLVPAPLKPVLRKPIMTHSLVTTSPRLASHERVSPLSPRAMFNTLGNNTKNAWKRASHLLSPGSNYSHAKKEGQGGFEFLDKDGSLRKNESEGTGTGKETLERRGSVFGRRSRSSSKVWTGQWI